MSDFDKEAEREKLREKYGEEEEKRKATEQMSELLLKGATMTNAHCTDCGDPIFRYDGQEFCPTCQKPVARDQSASDEDADDHIEVADPSDEATVQFGDGSDEQTANGAAEAPDEQTANGAAGAADGTAVDGVAEAADASTDAAGQPPAAGSMGDTTREIPSADPDRTPGASRADAGSEPTAPTATGSDASAATPDSPARSQHTDRSADDSVTTELSSAEALLAETVNRFARRAADTDDPRTAREHLKAAREAAEALDAVRF